MSLAAILGALGSVSAIVGGLVYVFKYSTWALTKTQAQVNAGIDQANQDDKHTAETTGRPQ